MRSPRGRDASDAAPTRRVRADVRAARSPAWSNHPRAPDRPSPSPSDPPPPRARRLPLGTVFDATSDIAHGGRHPQRPPAGTPGSARSGAFGFTCDSDSDGDDALLGSAAAPLDSDAPPPSAPAPSRAPSAPDPASSPPRDPSARRPAKKPPSSNTATPSKRKYASSRPPPVPTPPTVPTPPPRRPLHFEPRRIASRRTRRRGGERRVASPCVGERAAAATVSERERAALTSRVADLEHAMEEAETCLRAASLDAEKLRRRQTRERGGDGGEARGGGDRRRAQGRVARLHAALERAAPPGRVQAHRRDLGLHDVTDADPARARARARDGGRRRGGGDVDGGGRDKLGLDRLDSLGGGGAPRGFSPDHARRARRFRDGRGRRRRGRVRG